MKNIEDKSVNMILSDPPYGTTACKWDSIIPLGFMWEQLKRIIKPNGAIVVMASQPFTSFLIMSNPTWFKYSWVWCKNRATGHIHAKNKPMKQHEDICVFSEGTTVHTAQSKNRMIYNPQGLINVVGKTRKRNDRGDDTVMSKRESHKETKITHTNYPISIINFDIEMNDKRLHPTQKPVALFEYLIKTYTNEGDLVLDNCAGSGTTGVACLNLNRRFTLIEKEQEYIDIIEKRLNKIRQLRMSV